jgi:hypothetical protein
MVGWWGDLAKVASQRSLPELGFGRDEGASVAWRGPRARREFVRDHYSRPRLARAGRDRVPWADEALTLIAPISLCSLCWWWLPAEFRSVGGTPSYGTRQVFFYASVPILFLFLFTQRPCWSRVSRTRESLAISSLSFVGFVNMPTDPQIIDTYGLISHKNMMACLCLANVMGTQRPTYEQIGQSGWHSSAQIPVFRIRIRVFLYSGWIRVISGYCNFGFGRIRSENYPVNTHIFGSGTGSRDSGTRFFCII